MAKASGRLFLAEQFKDRFCGMVADIVETDEMYELALEAVMGEKLQYVICPDDDAALAAVDFLKETLGRAMQSRVARTFVGFFPEWPRQVHKTCSKRSPSGTGMKTW